MEAAGYFLCRDGKGIDVLSGHWLRDFTLPGVLVLTYRAFMLLCDSDPSFRTNYFGSVRAGYQGHSLLFWPRALVPLLLLLT